MKPDLGHLVFTDVGDLDGVVFRPPAGPFGAGREQRDSVLVVGDDVVHLEVECAAGELEGPAKSSRT